MTVTWLLCECCHGRYVPSVTSHETLCATCASQSLRWRLVKAAEVRAEAEKAARR